MEKRRRKINKIDGFQGGREGIYQSREELDFFCRAAVCWLVAVTVTRALHPIKIAWDGSHEEKGSMAQDRKIIARIVSRVWGEVFSVDRRFQVGEVAEGQSYLPKHGVKIRSVWVFAGCCWGAWLKNVCWCTGWAWPTSWLSTWYVGNLLATYNYVTKTGVRA